jgi:hypothetical protein
MLGNDWLDLVGCLTSNAASPYGMTTLDHLLSHGSTGLDEGSRGRRQLTELAASLLKQGQSLAAAIGPQALAKEEPLIAFFPSAAGRRPHAACTWRAAGGRRFIASTLPLPELASADATFATSNGHVRCEELIYPPAGWKA